MFMMLPIISDSMLKDQWWRRQVDQGRVTCS